jgi:outer membrane protein insertion porin family
MGDAARMGMSVGALRRLGLAAALIFLGSLCSVTLLLEAAERGFAQSAAMSGGIRVDVEGNRRVEADTIRSYFLVKSNERLDAAKIDSALKALYATGLFQDVHITPSPGRILVTVAENPVINRVAFEGNHKAKDEQLASEVQSKARGTFSRATVQADVQRILEIYQHSGRYDVRVVPKVVELPNGRVDLIFEIDEGQKTGVAKIGFVGNKKFGDYRLRDVIKTGETNWLSWFKSNDIYDADRIEADRDLLRRFYLRNGFADIRIVSAVGEYDPQRKGFVITFTIDEGEQYHFGVVNIQSNIPAVPGETLRRRLRVEAGRVYNADAIEKSVEDTTIDVARRGYPFAAVRPRGERNADTHTVNIVFVVDEGPHTYIERINIKGNTRTRDYVIRREFDIVEGDAYNRALVDRAERRIKGLGYFKTVKMTTEPGSAPDRIIINCDVEEQSTGEFSFAGGFSTADGLLGEVSIGERNFLGRGEQAKVSVQYGQYARGFNVSFVEPYVLDQRLALGFDVFAKQTTATIYLSYLSTMIGGDVKLGIPISENLSAQLRYTVYDQAITLPAQSQNCNNINPSAIPQLGLGTYPTPLLMNTINPETGQPFVAAYPLQTNCYQDGEASIPIKMELAQGPVLESIVGYSLIYSTLDNNKSPANGYRAELRQDFAGLGGDVKNVKSTFDSRLYNEFFPDIVGLFRVQGGFATGWGGQQLRVLDDFQAGPNIVRGFQPAGFGPRDITQAPYGYSTTTAALGGSMYWGTSVEVQTPMFFAPKDFGMKLAFFADAGQLLDYTGPTANPLTGEVMVVGGSPGIVRSSVGTGLIWDSPFGPLRFDLAFPITKGPYDIKQIFMFGGGGRF